MNRFYIKTEEMDSTAIISVTPGVIWLNTKRKTPKCENLGGGCTGHLYLVYHENKEKAVEYFHRKINGIK